MVYDATTDALLAMGAVLEAHRNRAFVRAWLKSLAGDEASARADAKEFGRFEDCGQSYGDMLSGASAVMRAGVFHKKSAERHFTRLRCEFIETYPAFADELRRRLDAQAAEPAAASRHPAAEAVRGPGI